MGGFAALNASSNSKAEKEKKKKEKEEKKREKEKKAAKKEAKAAKEGRSPTASEGNADFTPPASPSGSPAKPAAGALDEKTFKSKAKSIVEEYFSIVDLKEATECVQELNSPEHHWVLVTESIDIGFSKKEKECEQVGDLWVALYNAGVLTTEQLEKGLFDIIEFLPDMEIDVPMAGKWLAIMMAKCIVAGAISIGCFSRAPTDIWQPDAPSPASYAVKIMAAVQAESDAAKLSELVASDSFDVTAMAKDGEDVAALLSAANISL